MQLRRINSRQRAGWATPVLAALTSVAVLGAAAFGGNEILKTQEIGSGPIEATSAESNFAAGATVVVDDPAIATQGEGEGPRAVKEFHRDETFSQFALTWTGDRDVAAFVRAKQADGSWSQWYAADPIGVEAAAGAKTGTELIYVGPTNDIQVSVGNIDMYAEGTSQAGERTLPADLDVVFIDGNAQEGIDPVADLESDSMPDVVSRAGWGANEGIRCSSPTYDNGVKALTLHHTAGSNNYTRAQAAAQVRGAYQYHAQTLGWCDIGYNVLVDKFGTIYEGRYGGLDRAVQGAHVGGFNSNNWGISMMGNYSEAEPSQAMLESVSEIAGWKAYNSGFDPMGTTSLYSGGFSGSRYAAGQYYTGPAFMGHRDLHITECPGDNTIRYWPQIRRDAKTKYDALSGTSGSVNLVDDNATGEGKTSAEYSSDENGTGNSGSNSVEDVISSLGGNTKVPVSTIQAVIGIAASVAAIAVAAGAVNSQNLNVSQQSIGGLNATEIPGIVSKVIGLTGNAGLQESWTAVLNAFGPLLGLAVGGPDLKDIDSQLVYQLFSNGVVLSSKDTGTHALVGQIAQKWAQNPASLGLPTSDEYSIDIPGGKAIRVDFQGGYITFDPATQKVDVFNN